MGNINDYALPQMKTLLGLEGVEEDADCLAWLEQAVHDLRRGMTVTVDDTSYELSPAPVATSALWNVLAQRGRYLYLQCQYQQFLRELEGASSYSDEVTRFSRTETMRARRDELDNAKKEFMVAKLKYSYEDEPAFEAMEEREDGGEEYTQTLNLEP